MVKILDKITPRFGSHRLAYSWYRTGPLSGFSGQSAMAFVRAVRAVSVLEYLESVDAGILA